VTYTRRAAYTSAPHANISSSDYYCCIRGTVDNIHHLLLQSTTMEVGHCVKSVRGTTHQAGTRYSEYSKVVVVVVVEYLYSASRSASNALIVPQRCEEMSL